MNKKSLTKRDICTKLITPALRLAGWDVPSQVRKEVHFTKGWISLLDRLVTCDKAKHADYVLYYKPNIPIVPLESKDNHQPVGDRMQQALVNKNPDLLQQNEHHVMQITSDNSESCVKLCTFIYPEAKYPVTVTTSRHISTGGLHRNPPTDRVRALRGLDDRIHADYYGARHARLRRSVILPCSTYEC